MILYDKFVKFEAWERLISIIGGTGTVPLRPVALQRLSLRQCLRRDRRYREGIDKPEYVKWKTHLRCALNKAQGIDYLEYESQTQEDLPEPFRVYEFKL